MMGYRRGTHPERSSRKDLLSGTFLHLRATIIAACPSSSRRGCGATHDWPNLRQIAFIRLYPGEQALSWIATPRIRILFRTSPPAHRPPAAPPTPLSSFYYPSHLYTIMMFPTKYTHVFNSIPSQRALSTIQASKMQESVMASPTACCLCLPCLLCYDIHSHARPSSSAHTLCLTNELLMNAQGQRDLDQDQTRTPTRALTQALKTERALYTRNPPYCLNPISAMPIKVMGEGATSHVRLCLME